MAVFNSSYCTAAEVGDVDTHVAMAPDFCTAHTTFPATKANLRLTYCARLNLSSQLRPTVPLHLSRLYISRTQHGAFFVLIIHTDGDVASTCGPETPGVEPLTF